MLAELFGLTPAEIRLSLALADGGSLRSTAERHMISINTARSQLASIFSKTSIKRQVDLVEMLMSFT